MKVAEENLIKTSKENLSDSFQSMQVEKAAPKSTGSGTTRVSCMQLVIKLCTEGHTAWDCLLTVACAQIGQVMLVMPHSMALLGIKVGIVVALVAAIGGLWTMYLLASLYLEMKTRLIKSGGWYDASGKRRQVTQYHEVMGFHAGPVMKYVSQIVIAVHLVGTCTAQIVACASNNYSITLTHDKRFFTLVWGAVLMCFSFVPTFRHFRIINIIALVGTAYTEWFLVAVSAQKGITPGAINRSYRSAQDFFIGAAVLGQFGHSIALEMADAMRNAWHFQAAYTAGWLWVLTLILPHSIAANLAWPEEVYEQDNIFNVIPNSPPKYLAVWLMNIHQVVAFGLYSVPLMFMWEKLIRVHSKPWYIRLPLRLPISALLYVISVAFPFYGTINSLYSSLSEPLTAFVFPCAVYSWVYRTRAAREQAALKPFKCLRLWSWSPVFAINVGIILVWTIAQFGFGTYFSILRMIQNVNSFGVFAACYQCKASSALAPPAPVASLTSNFTSTGFPV
ncbi:Auxin transporter-like protein 1 [Coccomyxa sp. Obi]|nr:Auxin transporter-like protein 1 [Coccomyxa sp. Obi]